MKIKLLIFLLYIVVVDAFPFADIRFYNISDIYGTPMREVYSICKDDKGFIWSASKTGVLRISDSDFRVYQLPFVSTDIFFTRLVFTNSQLIVYTSNGQFFLYDELYDRFVLFLNIRESKSDPYIGAKGMTPDDDGNLWIGTSGGIYYYSDGQLTLASEQTTDVQCLALYDTTSLFVATSEGLGLYNRKTFKLEYVYTYSAKEDIMASSLLYDKEKNLFWIGTISSGLFKYDLNTNLFLPATINGDLPKQPILAIKKNVTSSLLIGYDGQGIWELAEDGESLLNFYKEDVNDPYSLPGDGVYDIFSDNNGRIWVATFTGGLSFSDQNTFSIQQVSHQVNNSNSLVNNNVNKVLEDSRGNIWFATNNGISHWNIAENRWRTYLSDNQGQAKVFLALCEDNNGNIWAGTYSAGVYVLDGNNGKELNHYFKDDNKSDNAKKFITDILKDTQGNLWIGGPSHVVCYIEKEKRFREYDPQPICSFEELNADTMLLACSYGLLSLDKNTGETEILFDNCVIQDIFIIGNDIWLGSGGYGLIRYDFANRTTEKYTTEFGLISNYVNSIMYWNDCLWLGTENGLCQFELTSKLTSTYPMTSLLSTVSYNSNSCWHLRNGNFIWGTNKGAVVFEPGLLEHNVVEGEIFFQDIQISGKSIRENEKLLNHIPVNKQKCLSLNYNQNNFILQLVPLGTHMQRTNFSWKMEGLDDNWTSPSDLRSITYTSLPDGEFEFKVKMYDSSLSQVVDERTLFIHVSAPFWKTWRFRLFLLILIMAVIVYSLIQYSNYLRQKHAKDKIRFFTNMAHDIRTSLTLINAPLERLGRARELSDESRYYLAMANDQSERLSFVATQLLDFEKVDIGKGQIFLIMTDVVRLITRRVRMFEAAAEKKNVKLCFSANKETCITAIDELKIEKVIDNLISNAIKYSYPNTKIDILFTCTEDKWILEVKDYGMGISDNAKNKLFREFYRGDNAVNSKIVGSGIGLLLVKNYVLMHNGHIHLDSKENVGSSFKIDIPCRQLSEPVHIPEVSMEETSKIDKPSSGELPERDVENKEIRKMHILVVEDNSDLQDFLMFTLQEQHIVSKAANGIEAWEMIKGKTPDLVISDVMMPGMDGFELCRLIKSTFETSHIPVILLTSLSEKAKQLEGLGLGADDYMTKPFDMSILSSRINSILKNREMVRRKAWKLIETTKDENPILSNKLNDEFIKKALEVVRSNMDNCEFGKDEFASAMHVSSSLLYKKLKTLTDESPTDFIKAVRLNHALELLRSHTYSVTEVSELCGFSSINYFSRTFKKHFGKLPTEV